MVQSAILRVQMATVLAGCATAVGQGGWTVVNLHSGAFISTRANAGRNGQQVGVGIQNGLQSALLWSGSAASRIDLSPPGSAESAAAGIDMGVVAGSVRFGQYFHAGYWEAGTRTWVDLHPSGAFQSGAAAISGNRIAGSVGLTGGQGTHAAVWTIGSEGYVDLNATNSSSWLLAIDGDLQSGYANVGGALHASLWSGTVSSWVDLNPAHSSESKASAVSADGPGVPPGGEVGGYTRPSNASGRTHASIWHGSAESWVDLNGTAYSSEVRGVAGGYQVGNFNPGGPLLPLRASLWHGTAESLEDLSLSLPGSWGTSQAESVWIVNGVMYISGWGRNNSTAREEALLWSRPIPAPASSGVLVLACVLAGRRLRCPATR
jgi:hypothetical protein